MLIQCRWCTMEREDLGAIRAHERREHTTEYYREYNLDMAAKLEKRAKADLEEALQLRKKYQDK